MKIKLLSILSIGCIALSVPAISSCGTTGGGSVDPVDPVGPTVTKYTVKMDLNGGSLDGHTGTFSRQVEEGTTYGDLGTPTLTNYRFKCWTKNGVELSQSAKITSNVTIRANYEPIGDFCDISIDLNGGILGGQSGIITKTVLIGSTYEDLGLPSKEYFSFGGWLNKGQTVSQSDQINETVAIKANWNPDDPSKCLLKINLNGGVLGGSIGTIEKYVDKNTTYESLGIPTKGSYNFTSWQKDGKLLLPSEQIASDDETIEALWSPIPEPSPEKPWEVTFDLDGGVMGGLVNNKKPVVDEATYASIGEPTKTGSTFNGWLNQSGAPIDPSDTISENVSVKASWETLSITPKNAHFFVKTNDNYLDYEDSGISFTIYLINDSQVPYVTVDSLFYNIFEQEVYPTRVGNVFTFANPITSSSTDITCSFDIDNQTISFNDYDKFVCYSSSFADNPLATGCGGGSAYTRKRVDQYTSGGTYTIDLKKYNIPMYCSANNVYIPYDFCNNIFDYDLSPGGRLTGSYMFVRNNFYEIMNDYRGFDEDGSSYCYNLYSVMREYEGIPSHEQIFNLAYREYAYNLLALTMDTRFGMTVRPSRSSPGNLIEYFPNGAYEALEKYHDDFVSTEANVANDAMIDIMKYYCDDGGHAGYSGCDVNAVDKWSRTTARVGPELVHTSYTSNWMESAREEAGHALPSGYDSYIEILSSSGNKKDIAWVTFDSFIAGNPRYDYITAGSYMIWGTEGMTMYLQKIVNAPGSTIKNIVIDLSNNGGGTVYTEHMLASYLCGRDNQCEPHDSSLGYGGVTHTIWNPHSKAFSKYTYYADINQDGVYDSDDYVPYGVQVYCIVSDNSFSCGNMLPSHLEACSNCKFIGSRSGGGACYVDSNMHIGLGNVFRSSSNFHALKNRSTIENPITVDEGVTAEFYPIPCDLAHARMFFDREAIINYINLH